MYHAFSVLRVVSSSGSFSSQVVNFNSQRITSGETYSKNVSLTIRITNIFRIVCFVTWLYILLLCSGDVHPNPGPTSSASNDSFSSSSSNISNILLDDLNQNHHLAFVHYNVQSLLTKIDIIQAELHNFDLIALTETWLHPGIDIDEVTFYSFSPPERKDRHTDRHGGVMLYVKEGITYRRRRDLEPGNVECIWIEITNRNKHLLFGVFYIPPNADSEYFSLMDTSLNLAIDTEHNNIIATGDFKLNMLTNNTARKIHSLCSEFALHQSIAEPTHYTETSSSLIDLILVHNQDSLVASGVGDPFLEQDLRFHCPIFGLLKFTEPNPKLYTRQIWNYGRGVFQLLRAKTAETDWDALRHENFDIYATNITNHILNIAKECIPTKVIRVRPTDPPWLTSRIKSYIRKRKNVKELTEKRNGRIRLFSGQNLKHYVTK